MIMNIVGGRPGEECTLHLLDEDLRHFLPLLAVKEGHRFPTTSVIVVAGVVIGKQTLNIYLFLQQSSFKSLEYLMNSLSVFNIAVIMFNNEITLNIMNSSNYIQEVNVFIF